MLSKSFTRTYDRLVIAFKRHQSAPRSVEHIRRLAVARWDLELARKAMAIERAAHLATRTTAEPSTKRVAMSDDELARLRVQAAGLGH